MKLKKLKDERGEYMDLMEEINSKATKEKRVLTAKEKREWDEAEGEINKLNKEIAVAEAEQQKIMDRIGKESGRGLPVASEWVDTRSGNPVQVYKPGERMSGSVGSEDKADIGRLIRSWVTSDWKGAEVEQRLVSSNISSAGITIPQILSSQILDLARDKSRVIEAGAQTVAMESNNLTIARLKNDPTGQWKAEGEVFTYNDVAFDGIEMKAFTLGTMIKLSREIFSDSANGPALIQNSIAEAIAGEIDRIAMFGTGTGQPLGIQNVTGIQSMAAVGALHWDDLIDANTNVETRNGTAGAYILSPRDAGAISKLKTTDGQYLAAPPSVAALRGLKTNKIPVNLGTGTNESILFFGDFSQILFGVRQSFLLETATEANGLFEGHEVGLKATFRGTVAVLRPEHLVKLEGITV